MSTPLIPLDVVQLLVEAAMRAGASAADAVAVESDGLEIGIRLGEPEKLRRARERRAGLRVFTGAASAIVSTADMTRAALATLAGDALALARSTAADPHAGLAAPGDLARGVPALDLHDPAAATLDPEQGFALAERAERAAFEAEPSVTRSEGAEFSGGESTRAYATSHGFVGSYDGSFFNLAVIPVATADGTMQRDSWSTAARWLAQLDPPEEVGRIAAQRAARRLGGRQVPTGHYPVVFDPLAATSLLRHLGAAIAGPSLYRRASFLLDRLGEPIASPLVTIVDDPTRVAGPASRPFDGEGVRSERHTIVERGVLRSYLLDSYAARRLGLATTGHAARPVGDAPSVAPTNFSLEPGPDDPETIIASVDRGLYVTELIGFGVNLVTGDYSRGAAGLWIERGELTHPVEQVTIAGNLATMLASITRVGTDLDRRRATSAPTLRIDDLTIAGG